MKDLNITEKQKENLVQEISNIVIKYKKNEKVECIFITPFETNGKGILEITLVANFEDFSKERFNIIKYNNDKKINSNFKKYGLDLYIKVDTPAKYLTSYMNPSELKKTISLYNATILFDKTGKYTKIKTATEKSVAENKDKLIYYYDNLGNIVPPIINDTKKKIIIKSK